MPVPIIHLTAGRAITTMRPYSHADEINRMCRYAALCTGVRTALGRKTSSVDKLATRQFLHLRCIGLLYAVNHKKLITSLATIKCHVFMVHSVYVCHVISYCGNFEKDNSLFMDSKRRDNCAPCFLFIY